MKIIGYTDNPTALKQAIDKKINDNELKTWSIVKNNKGDILYTHTPEQWNEKSMPMPYTHPNRIEFIMTHWSGQENNEATDAYILGRFVEILMVHFRTKFTHLEIK